MRIVRLLVALLTSLALSFTNVVAIAGTHCIDGPPTEALGHAGHAAHHGHGAHHGHAVQAEHGSGATAIDEAGSTTKAGTAGGTCSHCAYCQSCVSPLFNVSEPDLASSSPSSLVKSVVDDRVSASDPEQLFRPPRSHSA